MFSFLVFALVVGNRDGADQNLPATRKEDLTAERKGSFEENRVSKSSLSDADIVERRSPEEEKPRVAGRAEYSGLQIRGSKF